MPKRNRAILFVEWIVENDYVLDSETKMWSFQDLPFLWTTEELYKEFIEHIKNNTI
jgi:hypothetical protein